MNWTGGGLSRHSRNAKGGITAKQKEHFAKVRSAQQGVAPKISPAKWSVFSEIASASRDRSQLGLSDRPHRARNVYGAANVEMGGLAEDSVGQRERHRKRPHTSVREGSQDFTYSLPARPPDSEGIYMSELEPEQSDEHLHSRLQSKRKRGAETSQTGNVEHDESTMDKRRKILSKMDWVGVTFQQRPDLKYRPPEKIDQIGKRRKVSRGHHARYEQRRREISPALMRQLPRKYSHETKPLPDVRISIGGKELRVGVSSSSDLAAASLDPAKRTPGAASSDIMLLDCEEAEGQGLSRKHDYCMDKRVISLIDSERNSPIDANPSGTQRSSNHAGPRNPSSNYSERTLTTSEIRKLYNDFRNRPEVTPAPRAGLEGREQSTDQAIHNIPDEHSGLGLNELMQGSGGNSTPASSDQFTLLSFGDTHKTTRDPNRGHLEPAGAPRWPYPELNTNIFRSPPLMQHPVPHSSRISQILPSGALDASDTSDAGASMFVETGKVEPALTQENLDEEVWRSWSLSKDESLDQTEVGGVWEPDQLSLTPGISMYDARSRISGADSVEEIEDSTEQQHLIEDDMDDEDNITNNDESALQVHKEMESYLYSASARSRADSEEQMEVGLRESFTRSEPTSAPDPCNMKSKVDENELWQKFVFTSDSDGEESTRDGQTSLRKSFLMPRELSEDSSLFAHASTETDDPSQQPLTMSRASPSRYENSSYTELEHLMTELPPYDPETDERVSLGATQATIADISPSVLENSREEPYDGQTTHATQGSYRSSPDILSTGSPIMGSYIRNLTGSRSNIEAHKSSAMKQKFVFTKPKPFIGKGSTASGSKAAKRPLRIGRKLVMKHDIKGKSGVGEKGRGEKRGEEEDDSYDSESMSDDEVESTEDF